MYTRCALKLCSAIGQRENEPLATHKDDWLLLLYVCVLHLLLEFMVRMLEDSLLSPSLMPPGSFGSALLQATMEFDQGCAPSLSIHHS